jgi:hypothetical protein
MAAGYAAVFVSLFSFPFHQLVGHFMHCNSPPTTFHYPTFQYFEELTKQADRDRLNLKNPETSCKTSIKQSHGAQCSFFLFS